jgi:hypothetical protein
MLVHQVSAGGRPEGISCRGGETGPGPGKPRAAALVFDYSGTAQGWCQNGSPEELLGIKYPRKYGKDALEGAAWRITCFRQQELRGQGITCAALDGALD